MCVFLGNFPVSFCYYFGVANEPLIIRRCGSWGFKMFVLVEGVD